MVTASRSRSVFDYVRAPAPRTLMRLALIRELVELLPARLSSFLEIGPGLGDLSLFLADRHPEASATLVELSQRSVDILAQRVAETDRFRVRPGSFMELDPDRSFDLVIACEVFEHVEDEDSAFAKVRGLLDPNGHFLFSAPGAMIPWGAADRFAGHYRRYSRRDIEDRFDRHGFRIQRLWCTGFPLAPVMFPLHELYYRWRASQEPTTRLEATKRSGFDRRVVARLGRLPIAALMKPLFLCQGLTRNRDLGDGYVVLATPSGR